MKYYKTMNHGIFAILICALICVSCPGLLSAGLKSLSTPDVEVVYEDGSLAMAEEVAGIYPAVRRDLNKLFSWKTDFAARIILIRDGRLFARAAGGEIFLAYAVPGRYDIVLDASRVYARPFTLEATLRHEVCHLILHHHIPAASLPRWLDEGVCQWASDGISELAVTKGSSALAEAVIADRVLNINEIEIFPGDEQSLVLAYEQSKSLVEHIESRYGRDGILRILEYARQGHAADESIRKGLGVSLPELELLWLAHLKGRHTWLYYLSSNLYTILFMMAGIATIYGFLRFLKRKREYADEEDDGL